MATLRRLPNGPTIALEPHTLIGRAASCTLRLESLSVSNLQASLECRADGWYARNLSETNPTLVDDQPAPAGGKRLQRGSVLYLGEAQKWVFDADGASLPAPIVSTEQRRWPMHESELVVWRSRNMEEFVVELSVAGKRVTWKDLDCFNVLHVLALRHIEDVSAAPAERGWMSGEELFKSCSYKPERKKDKDHVRQRINTLRDLAKLTGWFKNPGDIIHSRRVAGSPDSRRLGVGRATVRPLEERSTAKPARPG